MRVSLRASAGAPENTGARLGLPFLRLFLPLCVVFWWSLYLTRPLSTGMGQDFTTMYVGALCWLQRGNPYTTQAPVFVAARLHVMQQGVVNSPLLLALDAPLTLLAPRAAFLAYVALQYLYIAAAAWLLARTFALKRPALFTLAILASPATFLIGYYGQIGALVFLCVSLALWARTRRWDVLMGICLACALVKPQLGVCAALPLLWGASRRAWMAAALSCIALVGVMALMLGPAGLLGYVHVMQGFGSSAFARQNIDGLDASSLYKGWLAPALASHVPLLLASGLAALVVVMARRYGWRPPDHALVALTYCGVLLLPYSHQYDAIALIPALVLARDGMPRCGAPRLAYYLGCAIMLVTPLTALLTAQPPFRLFPLGLLLCLCALMRAVPQQTEARPAVELAA